MADDKRNSGARDRATVAGGETYELDYFAKKHDLSREDARALIDRVGNGRDALEAAVAGGVKLAAARKDRTVKAVSKSSGSSSPLRKPAAGNPKKASSKGPARSLVGAAVDMTTPLTAAVGAAAKPVKQAIAPVIGSAGRKTAVARKVVAAAPKAASRRAGVAVGGVKSALTGRTASLVGAAAAGLVTGLAVNLGRKVVVQAPSALAGDWLDALKTEHRMALKLFDALQATGSDDTGKRTTLLTQLKHALGKHAFTEENVIYPALRAHGDKADADKLNHEHGYVKQYLYELEEMDNASPAFLPMVASFRAELEEHIREEEDMIFPPLHSALGEAGNAKVTAQANKEGFKLA